MMTIIKILGIDHTASSAEIKDAFRRLTKLYHPDKHSNSKQSHSKYIKIVEAFTVLSNMAKREEYDRKIATFNTSRSAYKSANSTRYNNGARSTVYKPQKPKPTFLEYALINGDLMVLGEIEDMLPNYGHRKAGHVKNDVFPFIRCDKVGLFYSSKRRMFYWLAVNDNYTLNILFKGKELKYLPNTSNINIESGKYQIIENANRLICSVYNRNEILDLSSNPTLSFQTHEIFKK